MALLKVVAASCRCLGEGGKIKEKIFDIKVKVSKMKVFGDVFWVRIA